jgi:hypothetical protein
VKSVYFDDVGQFRLDMVEKLLAGVKGGVFKAVGSALKRSSQHGLTVGMRIVSEEYAIGYSVLKESTRNINTIVRSSAGSYEVTFGYRGNVIPLIKFDTSVGRDGTVSARVLRVNSRAAIENAFRSQIGTHSGIFERVGKGRFPVKELYGPSAVQAFFARESTIDKMDEAIRKKYEERIDHEVTRILNGWGV